MVSEIISSEAALIGGGTWFAAKIFGPSADALGENLKVYLQSRVPKIFNLAAQRALSAGLEVKALPPGLAARLIMDASFSADDPELTSWWADLFLSAAHADDNKHAAFSDMMSTIGPKEASCLKDFVESTQFGGAADAFRTGQPIFRGFGLGDFDQTITDWVGETPISEERAPGVYQNLTYGEMFWPARIINWSLPFSKNVGFVRINLFTAWYQDNRTYIEILERSRILKYVKVDIPVMGRTYWVELVELTALGCEFYSACTRHAKNAGDHK